MLRILCARNRRYCSLDPMTNFADPMSTQKQMSAFPLDLTKRDGCMCEQLISFLETECVWGVGSSGPSSVTSSGSNESMGVT